MRALRKPGHELRSESRRDPPPQPAARTQTMSLTGLMS